MCYELERLKEKIRTILKSAKDRLDRTGDPFRNEANWVIEKINEVLGPKK